MNPGLDGDPGPPMVRQTPEGSLWISVLVQAANDASGTSVVDREAAIAWLNSPRTDPGSALWVCDLLDLDIDTVLNRVTEARRQRPVQDRLAELVAFLPTTFMRRDVPSLLPGYNKSAAHQAVAAAVRRGLLTRNGYSFTKREMVCS